MINTSLTRHTSTSCGLYVVTFHLHYQSAKKSCCPTSNWVNVCVWVKMIFWLKGFQCSLILISYVFCHLKFTIKILITDKKMNQTTRGWNSLNITFILRATKTSKKWLVTLMFYWINFFLCHQELLSFWKHWSMQRRNCWSRTGLTYCFRNMSSHPWPAFGSLKHWHQRTGYFK